VRLLLDTHVVLWALEEPERIGDDTLARMSDLGSELLVSSATIWEVFIKQTTGKLVLPDEFVPSVTASGMKPLPVTFEHALAVRDLPLHHRDPFDRMLVAQAGVEGLVLVTNDRKLARYDVPILQA
jgi:PIN domain nuclease of toxin-antitoxin system